jgi:hypothetical protein
MSTPYYLKQLRLITPETAREMGINAEAPVFISPHVAEPRCCSLCVRTFGPLVYQTGYDIRAHHWHATAGGIYFFVGPNQSLGDWAARPAGWIAYFAPVGPVLGVVGDSAVGRAAGVQVLRIEAWCMGGYQSSNHPRHQLTAGHVLERPDGNPVARYVPTCSASAVPPCRTPFRFTIQDGQVFFTQREQP